MKELEKTKRISISAVLVLVILSIGFLTYKRPPYIFEKNTKTTLEKIASKSQILTLDKFKAKDPSLYILVDVRSHFEFQKGHSNNAVNIPANQMFEKQNFAFFKDLKNGEKTIIFYGKTPEQANSSWMLLYQLGYENVALLSVNTDFVDNKFLIKDVVIEKPEVNYAHVMQSLKGSKATTTQKKAAKKVIPLPKKKKRVAEGGC